MQTMGRIFVRERHVGTYEALSRVSSGFVGAWSGKLLETRRMAQLWEKETASINLGKGHPMPTLLDAEAVQTSLRTVLERNGVEAVGKTMQYGSGRGPPEMCEAVTQWMGKWGRTRDLRKERIMITCGASSGFDIICSVFSSPGDVVLVEAPSYFLAYGTLRSHKLKIQEISTDEGGLNVDELETKLQAGLRPSLMYIVPMCNNPKGTSLSKERSSKLVQLSREYNFKIASDEVYFFLQFNPKFANSLAEEDDEENPTVIAMHSMSKTLGPGTRVGWLDAHPDLIKQLLQFGPIVSGGCQSHFMANVVAELISSGKQEELLENFRMSYERGAKALTSALDEFLPEALGTDPYRFYAPMGGYFVWLELPENIDTAELQSMAEEKHGVFFFAGHSFCIDDAQFNNCLRLCFAMLEPSALREGVRRLANAIQDYRASKAASEKTV